MDPSQIPPPPAGWSKSLGGLNDSDGRGLFAITIIFIVLSWTAVGLRIWAKTLRKRALQPHDYFVFAALPFATAYAVIFAYGIVHGGIGLHITDSIALLGLEGTVILQKVYYGGSIVWVWATTLAKLSILNFCVRIFERKWFRWAAWGISVAVVLYGIIFFFLITFLCTPIAYNWDKSIDGHCLNLLAVQTSTAAINAALDLCIAVLPMNILWGLQMPTQKKVAVTILIGVGPIITILNVARIITEVTLDQNDATYVFGVVGLLAGLEIWLGIISACLPTFGALIFDREKRRDATPNLFGWRSRRSGVTPLVVSNESGSKETAKSSRGRKWGWGVSSGKSTELKTVSSPISPYGDGGPGADHAKRFGLYGHGQKSESRSEAYSDRSRLTTGPNDVVSVRTDLSVTKDHGDDFV